MKDNNLNAYLDNDLNAYLSKNCKNEKRIQEIIIILEWYKSKNPDAYYEIRKYEEELKTLKRYKKI